MLVAVAVLAAVALLLSRPVHARLLELIASADTVIRAHPLGGMVLFVVLAAVSAMLAFVSSTVLIPVAIYAWGPATCAALLWLGWFLGGILSYLLGRYLGRPIVIRLVRPGVLARYEGYARRGAAFVPIVLLQLAIPSDTAGYLFGLVRCPMGRYLLALAVAELPYAVGAVVLGASFLERRLVPLLVLGVAGTVVGVMAWWLVRRWREAESRASGVEGRSSDP